VLFPLVQSSRYCETKANKVAVTLGGAEGVTALLEAIPKSVGEAKKKRRAP
jgi:hypothetical protein